MKSKQVHYHLKKLLKWHSVTQNSIILKMIGDLGVRHHTRCEKYGNFGKQSDTSSETVGMLSDSNINIGWNNFSANQIQGPEKITVVYI